jgi:hypothetical protein
MTGRKAAQPRSCGEENKKTKSSKCKKEKKISFTSRDLSLFARRQE